MVEKMDYITACIQTEPHYSSRERHWDTGRQEAVHPSSIFTTTVGHRASVPCPYPFIQTLGPSSPFLINTHLLPSISLLSHLPSPPPSHISPPPPPLLFSSSPSLIAQPLQYFLHCRARQNTHTHSHTHGWQVKAGFSLFFLSSSLLGFVILHCYLFLFSLHVGFMLRKADIIKKMHACVCCEIFEVSLCVLQLHACLENGCQVNFVGAERDMRAYMCAPPCTCTVCGCVSVWALSMLECVW